MRRLLFALFALLFATTAAQAATPTIALLGNPDCAHAQILGQLAKTLGVQVQYVRVANGCGSTFAVDFELLKKELGTRVNQVLVLEFYVGGKPSNTLIKAFANSKSLLVAPAGNPGSNIEAPDSCSIYPSRVGGAVLVGVTGDRSVARAKCLSLNYGLEGSVGVPMPDGTTQFGAGTSTAALLVGVRAAVLATVSGLKPTQLKPAFGPATATAAPLVVGEEALFAPHVMGATLTAAKLNLSVSGPAVLAVYRGVQCNGNPIALVATGGTATVAVPKNVGNVCVRPVGGTQTFGASRQ